ncbi:competence/damage-inducible protein A [Neorhodopirellula pilleata]|uniref:CinA-like protein n=1 Tax=Neorhodopirellula pilleata TaxID=2714738 RepID=A0A5C6ASV1_9BACT|nr:CinA family nicotinamide mononucleotide deamidase-related protein [Neorhodopirellula pilleata]TWU03123.1 putative competence-damage inducible protein [Neorhodopirellula pilleata]
MTHFNAEIISIGDEMIGGARLDTNTQWLSRRLAELGVDVQYHTTVGDTLAHNTDVFRIALRRADIVVATGGLGPTRDDLTREAIAEALGRPLKLDEASLRHIESMFSRRGRDMPERNQVQAMFPLGSKPIVNPQGTAPGIDMVATRDDGTESRIFALPGVPAEMKTMFDQSVAPTIMASGGGIKTIRHAVLKFFGTGESDMEQRLGDMIARDRQPRVGITVSSATISLRISAIANTESECEALIAATREDIMQRVGDLYFGDGESFEQHHAVDQILKRMGGRLAVIELGRAAPLGNWFATLGDTPAFAGGVSLAKVDDLVRLTGTTPSSEENQTLADCFDVISERFQADWILLVNEYPDLQNMVDQVMPASEVTFTVRDPQGQQSSLTERLGGHPSIVQPRIAKAALMFLRQRLAKK